MAREPWPALLAGLSPEHREMALLDSRDRRYAKGERLFAENTPAHGCWLIRSGRVAIDVQVPGRGPLPVQTLGHGDTVGWSWLRPPANWRFGAVALTAVDTIQLDTDGLLRWCETDPTFGRAIAMAMFGAVADRLAHTRARLLDLYGSPHAHDR